MADPQVNPNALGAPAEGFGQTVSFAFDPRGVTPSLSLQKSTPSNGGVSGVSSPTLSNPNEAYKKGPEPDGTAALLMRVGGEILAPMVEKERNAKFVDGMQRAMQGEAIADMAAEQPWYSKVFGDTPALEGARAYGVSAKVNEVIATQTANMEQLKTLDSKSAAKHFAGVITSSMTGDGNSDALISKAMVDQLPVLMKAQAKAYYGHTQKVAMDAMSKHIATGASALQQAGQLHSEDTINESDFGKMQQAFVRSIMPPEGINEENYGKVLGANIRRAAEAGQFHAIEAIRKSGGFDAMTVEQQNVVNAAVTSAATKHRNDYAFQYVKEIAELRSDAAHPPTGVTPGDIAARYTKMNDAYRKVSGSPLGLFSSDEAANGATGTLNAIKAEELAAANRKAVMADRNATAEDKAAALAAQTEALDRAISTGDVELAVKMTKVTKDEADVAFMARVDSNPQSGDGIIRNNFVKSGYTNPILKDRLQSPLRNSEGLDSPTADWFKAVDGYRAMSAGGGSVALAQSYYGDYAPKIERFIRMTEGSPNGEQDALAFKAAMDRSGIYKREALGAKESVALATKVAGETNSMLPRWIGGKVNMRPDAIAMLTSIAGPITEDYRGIPGLTDEQAVGKGIMHALATGRVETLGGYAITRGEANAKLPKLREQANALDGVIVPEGQQDAYFEAFLEARGISGSGAVNMAFSGKAGGTERYNGTKIAPDGKVTMFSFSAAEWSRFAGERAVKDTSPPEKSSWSFGPAITYGTSSDAGRAQVYKERAIRAQTQAEVNRRASKP
jgi:hypothetical protein